MLNALAANFFLVAIDVSPLFSERIFKKPNGASDRGELLPRNDESPERVHKHHEADI